MPIPNPILIKTISLLKELKRQYGHQKAHEIWEKLADIIPDENLKMDVFKCMLSGGHLGYQFELQYWNPVQMGIGSKVQAIKALRLWTKAGLTECKKAVENAEFGQRSTFEIDRGWRVDEDGHEIDIPYEKFIAELGEVGLTVEMV